jgi:hypothetical protein
VKSLIAKTMPVILGLSLFAGPAAAQDPTPEPTPTPTGPPANMSVDSFVEADYSKPLLEGRVFTDEVNASNRMCSSFRKVHLYQHFKAKKGRNPLRLAAWDSSTADGVFKWRLDEGVWSVKVPKHTYTNGEGTKVECKAVKLADRFRVTK